MWARSAYMRASGWAALSSGPVEWFHLEHRGLEVEPPALWTFHGATRGGGSQPGLSPPLVGVVVPNPDPPADPSFHLPSLNFHASTPDLGLLLIRIATNRTPSRRLGRPATVTLGSHRLSDAVSAYHPHQFNIRRIQHSTRNLAVTTGRPRPTAFYNPNTPVHTPEHCRAPRDSPNLRHPRTECGSPHTPKLPAKALSRWFTISHAPPDHSLLKPIGGVQPGHHCAHGNLRARHHLLIRVTRDGHVDLGYTCSARGQQHVRLPGHILRTRTLG